MIIFQILVLFIYILCLHLQYFKGGKCFVLFFLTENRLFHPVFLWTQLNLKVSHKNFHFFEKHMINWIKCSNLTFPRQSPFSTCPVICPVLSTNQCCVKFLGWAHGLIVASLTRRRVRPLTSPSYRSFYLVQFTVASRHTYFSCLGNRQMLCVLWK